MQVGSCAACARALEARAARGTETVVCSGCGALVAVRQGRSTLIRPQDPDTLASVEADAPLALGATGTLRGRDVTVTGLLRRTDGADQWYEIAVADRDGEVQWLWVSAGHWSLAVCEGRECIATDPLGQHRYRDRRLRKFGRCRARFDGAVGEFPYVVDVGDQTLLEYVGPPYLASFEAGVWWVFEYLPRAEVETAFGIRCEPPDGIGPNQPAPYARQRTAFGLVTVLALIAAITVHSMLGRNAAEHALLAADVTLGSRDPAPQALGTLTLERPWNSLELELRSPVNNAWADVTLALVDQRTGRSFWTSQGVEYYSGVDADGGWNEGSTERSVLVRSIPAGTYALVARGDAGTWGDGAAPAQARVRLYDHPAPTSNLLLAILALLGFAGGFVGLWHRFETRRWADSDFPPEGS